MAQLKLRRKVIKALAKGQITIPTEFREALGIEAETLLSVSLVGDHLELAPLRPGDELRRYAEDDIARFLEEDKLDQATADWVLELIKRGKLWVAQQTTSPPGPGRRVAFFDASVLAARRYRWRSAEAIASTLRSARECCSRLGRISP